MKSVRIFLKWFKERLGIFKWLISLLLKVGFIISILYFVGFLFDVVKEDHENYLNRFTDEIVVEKIRIVSPPVTKDKIKGNYFIFTGEVEEKTYYIFYLMDSKGRKILKKDNAEEIYIVDYDGDPYVELEWIVHKELGKIVENPNYLQRNKRNNIYSNFSEYAEFGWLKTVTIYTPKGSVVGDVKKIEGEE